MSMHAPECRPDARGDAVQPDRLDKLLRAVSLLTMLMTVPQAYGVWAGGNSSGVSVLSWGTYLVSAVLWLVYGWRKRDKTIYLPCIGWIVLDGAIVAGVLVHAA